ncbi:MAG: protein kinase [Verrucomicrobia bacterium]|nr:protein kinase [Verrucomicrobiota bacterium]
MLSPGVHGAEEFAHFRLLRKADGSPHILGVGGMGITYKAHDPRLRLDVALKVVHPARLGDPDAQKLFIREARAAAQIRHPNVAGVVFLDDAQDRVFYAMEFIDGVSLHTWLRKHGRARVGIALGFAEQIAHGLGAIHEAGIIHRDLKPANLMVMEFPPEHPRHRALSASGGCQLKIIDFGLARGMQQDEADTDLDAPLPTTGFRGTAAYSSPEQCEEESDLDARSDLYSLGCILWELLAGRPPFLGRNQRELVNAHVAAAPPWELLRAVPEPVLAVLRRLLAKPRAERYASAAETAEALVFARRQLGPETSKSLLAPLPAPTPATPVPLTPLPVPPTAPAPTSSGTQITVQLPANWWIGVLALLGFAVVGASLLLLWRRPAPAPPAGSTPAIATSPAAASVSDEVRRRTVAVLPFTSRSPEGEAEYLAEGVHDDILSSLSKIKSVRVIAMRTTPKNRDLASEFGVGVVLEGSVRQQGTRIRVNTQLTEAGTGRQLWAETFDNELTSAFEIQSAVAREVARALETKISAGEAAAIARQPTKDREAYEIFLRTRARESKATRTREAQLAIAADYTRALELDPQFALAWAHLAKTHAIIYTYAIDQTPGRLALLISAARKAVDLDPGLPEAHVSMGRAISIERRDFESALREFRVALAIEPSNAEALDAAAHMLRRMGRWEEGLKLQQQAVELAPDDGAKVNALGTHLLHMRRYAESEAAFRRATALSNNAYREMDYVFAVLHRTQDWPAAEKRVRELIPRMPPDRAWRAQLEIGDYEGALKTVRAMPGDMLAYTTRLVPKSFLEGIFLHGLGDLEASRRAFAAALPIMRAQAAERGEDEMVRVRLAHALAGVGDKAGAIAEGEAAMRECPESEDVVRSRNVAEDFAEICGMLGEFDRGCEILERLLKVERRLNVVRLKFFPVWAPYRNHPRFQRILQQGM